MGNTIPIMGITTLVTAVTAMMGHNGYNNTGNSSYYHDGTQWVILFLSWV